MAKQKSASEQKNTEAEQENSREECKGNAKRGLKTVNEARKPRRLKSNKQKRDSEKTLVQGEIHTDIAEKTQLYISFPLESGQTGIKNVIISTFRAVCGVENSNNFRIFSLFSPKNLVFISEPTLTL